LPREAEEAEQDVYPPQSLIYRRKRLPVVLVALGALSCAVVIGAFSLLPVFTASATVTIIPTAVQVSATTLLTVVTTGVADPREHQVPGQLLSSLTISQARSVSTTGRGHRYATQAHGIVTFYNALPQEQTIPARTLLTTASDVQVVTDQDALLPAGSGATNGAVSVWAHALNPGPQGNIGAGTISGTCCRAYVLVTNSAPFVGGANARDFPMVTEHDLDGAISSLKASLGQSVQAALQGQVRADETLITPLPCHQAATADHQVGDETTHLAVVVTATCTGEAYATQALRDLLTQAVAQEATSRLGAGYSLTGEIQATVIGSSVSAHKPGVITLQVKGMGIWTSQFDTAQLDHMAQLIQGKSQVQATQTLLHLPGVSQVAINVSGGRTTLPTDTRNIHVLIFSQRE
jgi:hypothetical protein